jgi:hypothetical protein
MFEALARNDTPYGRLINTVHIAACTGHHPNQALLTFSRDTLEAAGLYDEPRIGISVGRGPDAGRLLVSRGDSYSLTFSNKLHPRGPKRLIISVRRIGVERVTQRTILPHTVTDAGIVLDLSPLSEPIQQAA